MEDSLAKRGRTLEELFFIQRDAELIAQRKRIEEMTRSKETLAEVSGIRDQKVLNKLVELEVSPSILATLAILPLVEVAWADGTLNEEERQAVLAEAARGGLIKGSVDYGLLEAWLKERPSAKFLEGWIHYIAGLRDIMDPQELDHLKSELLNRARKVANASGGILGLIGKTSPQEQDVLRKMEDAFKR